MDVRILESAHAVALAAADVCVELIRRKPDARLGLASGATPRALYAELVRRHRAGDISFSAVVTFNLDEYVGAGRQHPRSFYREMHESLFDHLDIDPSHVHLPAGDALDPHAEAAAYEALIAANHGIDLQILGIGRNGHVAFNEPGSSFASRTRIVTLTDETRRDNGLDGSALPAPVRAITMGVATILEARALLMIATGDSKARAIADAIEAPIDERCPASAIRRHPSAIVLLDRAAAAHLRASRDAELER